MRDVNAFVEAAIAAESVRGAWDALDAAAAAGEWEFFRVLLPALTRAGEAWQARSCLERAEQLLAAAEDAEACSALLSILPRKTRPRRHELAARLAAAQDVPSLERAFAEAEDPEFRACLFQEALLGDKPLRGCDTAAFSGEPLAWLPTELLDFESARGRIRFSLGGHGRSIGGAAAGTPLPAGAPLIARPRRTTKPGRLRSAVAGWLQGSNGRAESEEVALEPAQTGWTQALVGALEATATADATVLQVELPAVVARLFEAASSGGAYSRPAWGAYGRLHAWRSLGALAGAPASATASDVAEAARACRWVVIQGGSWFAHVAWDLGVGALRPDGASAAVLVATDED